MPAGRTSRADVAALSSPSPRCECSHDGCRENELGQAHQLGQPWHAQDKPFLLRGVGEKVRLQRACWRGSELLVFVKLT